MSVASRAIFHRAVTASLALDLVPLLIVLSFLLGIARAGVVLLHDPLLAYANSYDEVRYTACFDLYPDRPREIPPTDNSPDAPYSNYVFIASGSGTPMCYWSSELLPQGLVVLAWRVSEAIGGSAMHSVRALGALKFGLLLALCIAVSVAWWRRGMPARALANALLFLIVLADPANTLYANTFYAEWTALAALYATVSSILLFADRPPTRWRAMLLACAAFALGTSKLQHMLLPLLLGVVLVVVAKLRTQRWSWQGLAVIGAGVLALSFQIVQANRADPLIENIRLANAADVVLMGLLPASNDPLRTLARLDIDPACLAWSGRHAWELPDFDPERACPGMLRFSRAKELRVLLEEPSTALGFALSGIGELDSWLAKNLGTIEGGVVEPLPDSIASMGRVLLDHPILRFGLLVCPLLAFATLLRRRESRATPAGIAFAGIAATTILATWGVTLLGDGLADVPKQCHLAFNAATSWAVVVAATCILERLFLAFQREPSRSPVHAEP